MRIIYLTESLEQDTYVYTDNYTVTCNLTLISDTVSTCDSYM